MHITITDQQTGEVAIMCYERGAQHAEVLTSSHSMLRKLEVIAKALGADFLRMTIHPSTDVPDGWEMSDLKVIGRELNGT